MLKNSRGSLRAQGAMREIINRIVLQVNEEKTQVVNLSKKEQFDFLGYTIGTFYNKDGKSYYGTRPSRKAIKKVIQKLHEETSRRWLTTTPEERIVEINRILRGWCAYFNQGPVLPSYKIIRRYTEKRLRRWLVQKFKFRGTTGYRQFPDKFIYEKLGLYAIAEKMTDVPRAKA